MNSIILKILIVTWFSLFPIAAYMEGFNVWSFAVGVVFVLIPAMIYAWSEKGAEANRIAYHLCQEARNFMDDKTREWYQNNPEKTLNHKDFLPIENDKFKIILAKDGLFNDSFGMYSKQYECWFLLDESYNPGEHVEGVRDVISTNWYCDSNFRKLTWILNPHKFSLKKYLIPDKDLKELNKNSDY
jgi:hypothetical protein